MPLISIIIPIYNVEKYIHQCVDSVLSQTYKKYEIILVDDGSPDNCPVIIDEYGSKHSYIKVIHKVNGGLSDARNVGILKAAGEYLLFLDGDDYYADNDFLLKISRTVCRFSDVDVINYGFIKYYPFSNRFVSERRNYSITKNESETNRDYIKKMLQHDLFIASACNKCIKKDFIVNNKLFFEKGIRSEDMAWCGSILLMMPDMVCINMHPYVYRQERVDSITSSVDKSHIEDIVTMLKVALNTAVKLNKQDQFLFLSFYAVQYLTLLFNHQSRRGDDEKLLSADVYYLRKILKNDLNPKVKKVNIFMKFFGYKLMSRVLKIYILKMRK